MREDLSVKSPPSIHALHYHMLPVELCTLHWVTGAQRTVIISCGGQGEGAETAGVFFFLWLQLQRQPVLRHLSAGTFFYDIINSSISSWPTLDGQTYLVSNCLSASLVLSSFPLAPPTSSGNTSWCLKVSQYFICILDALKKKKKKKKVNDLSACMCTRNAQQHPTRRLVDHFCWSKSLGVRSRKGRITAKKEMLFLRGARGVHEEEEEEEALRSSLCSHPSDAWPSLLGEAGTIRAPARQHSSGVKKVVGHPVTPTLPISPKAPASRLCFWFVSSHLLSTLRTLCCNVSFNSLLALLPSCNVRLSP